MKTTDKSLSSRRVQTTDPARHMKVSKPYANLSFLFSVTSSAWNKISKATTSKLRKIVLRTEKLTFQQFPPFQEIMSQQVKTTAVEKYSVYLIRGLLLIEGLLSLTHSDRCYPLARLQSKLGPVPQITVLKRIPRDKFMFRLTNKRDIILKVV